MKIQTKRAYESPAATDGERYLVDRVWPRGVKREQLNIKDWRKEAAPSTQLRKWFNHDPQRWDEFRERYFKELDANPEAWKPLLNAAQKEPVTLVYGAKDAKYNQAAALKEYLEKK